MAKANQIALGIGGSVAAVGVVVAIQLGIFSPSTYEENEPAVAVEPEITAPPAPEVPIAEVPELPKGFSLDLARVEPTGEAVFAGVGPANVPIVISYSQGEGAPEERTIIARTTSTGEGQWAAPTDISLPKGLNLVWFGHQSGDEITYSDLHLIIVLPESADEEIIITEKTAEGVVSVTKVPAPKPAEPKPVENTRPPVTITLVDYTGGTLNISGNSAANAILRIYFDDQHQGDMVADGVGNFLYSTLERQASSLTIRIDELDGEGKVLSRAETQFEAPVEAKPEPEPKPEPELVSAPAAEDLSIADEQPPETEAADDLIAALAPAEDKPAADGVLTELVTTTDASKLDGEVVGRNEAGQRIILKDGKRYVENFVLAFEDTPPAEPELKPSPEPEITGTIAEAKPEPESEIVIAEAKPAPEPETVEVIVEAKPAPEPETVEVVVEAKPAPEPEIVIAEVKPAPEPETVEVIVEAKPAPEPETVEVVAEAKPATEPETVEVVVEAVPTPEPEIVIVEAKPEPEPVDVVVETKPEPEPETVEAAVETKPTPEPETVEVVVEAKPAPEPETVEAAVEAKPTPEPEAVEVAAAAKPAPEPEPAVTVAGAKPSPNLPTPSARLIPESVVVARGDSLWRIASRFYGEGLSYTVIYKENDRQIRNPDLIFPGQIFKVPKLRRLLTPIN